MYNKPHDIAYPIVASMMVEIELDKAAAAETKAKVEIEEINANEKAADAKVNAILNHQILLLDSVTAIFTLNFVLNSIFYCCAKIEYFATFLSVL